MRQCGQAGFKTLPAADMIEGNQAKDNDPECQQNALHTVDVSDGTQTTRGDVQKNNHRQ